MREYDVNTKFCSFVSLCSSVVAMAYLIVVCMGVLVDSWIACAVMRMLVRMTVFKTSDYLFLFRELPRKRRTKVVNKNKVLIMNNQNFINLLHKTVSPSQNS